jgi:hypothetical protein
MTRTWYVYSAWHHGDEKNEASNTLLYTVTVYVYSSFEFPFCFSFRAEEERRSVPVASQKLLWRRAI